MGCSAFPIAVMANDGGAAKALENADLDFLRSERDKPFEPARKAGHVFTGKADDEVGVDVHAGFTAEEAEVFGKAIVVLAALDAGADFGVEGLDADFELEGARRKFGDDFAKAVGQAVGNHFEVEEMAGLIIRETEFQDRAAGVQIKVESAIDEFEMLHAATEESFKRPEELSGIESTHRNVERREAEFARKRADTRRFDVADAIGDVGVRIKVVRKRELREDGKFRRNNFTLRRRHGEDGAAGCGKFQIRFAGDDVIGSSADRLGFRFEADFGPAEDNGDFGRDALEDMDHFGGERGVPDVNAQADNARPAGEQDFRDVVR